MGGDGQDGQGCVSGRGGWSKRELGLEIFRHGLTLIDTDFGKGRKWNIIIEFLPKGRDARGLGFALCLNPDVSGSWIYAICSMGIVPHRGLDVKLILTRDFAD